MEEDVFVQEAMAAAEEILAPPAAEPPACSPALPGDGEQPAGGDRRSA
jgi:hypothetical protein